MNPEPLLASTATTSPTSARLLRALLVGHPAADSVEVVILPDEADRRADLAAAGTPVFLLVGDGEAAPDCGFLEEWTRLPVPMDDVHARLEMLRGRVSCVAAPRLRPGGILEFASGQVLIAAGQLSIVQRLVEGFGSVVARAELAEVYEAAGGKATDEALKAAMFRLGQRVAEVGLVLRTIRGKGFLLEAATGCRVSHRPE